MSNGPIFEAADRPNYTCTVCGIEHRDRPFLCEACAKKQWPPINLPPERELKEGEKR